MKHSIRRQMMGLFIGLLICMLIALLAVNIWFLEPYYIQDKEEKFVAMYTSLKEAVLDGNLQGTISQGTEDQGRLSADACADLLEGKEVQAETIVDNIYYTADNAQEALDALGK